MYLHTTTEVSQSRAQGFQNIEPDQDRQTHTRVYTHRHHRMHDHAAFARITTRLAANNLTIFIVFGSTELGNKDACFLQGVQNLELSRWV